MKIAITGHRPNKLGNDYNLTSPLIMKIEKRIVEIIRLQDPTTLISGMALGIDTLFAKISLKLRIPLIAAVPCLNQDKMWVMKSKILYGNLLANPLTTVYFVTKSEYTNSCMQVRNKWMVDNCDMLIAVWDGTPGGTANCVKYAQGIGKSVVFIDPSNI